MPYQQPQISLPITLTNATVTIVYNGLPDDVVNLAAGTYFNDGSSSSLLSYVEGVIEVASPLTWSYADPDGAVGAGGIGRSRLRASGADFVTKLVFSDPAWSTALGYDTDQPVPDVVGPVLGVWTSTADSAWCQQGRWIAQPSSTSYTDPDDWRDTTQVLASQSPTGAQTTESYGTIRQRGLYVDQIGGANARASYLAAQGYRTVISPELQADDPHHCWEALVLLWQSIDGAARLAMDGSDPTDYVEVYPWTSDPWWADPSAALSEARQEPLYYVLSVRLLEVIP